MLNGSARIPAIDHESLACPLDVVAGRDPGARPAQHVADIGKPARGEQAGGRARPVAAGADDGGRAQGVEPAHLLRDAVIETAASVVSNK